MINYILSKLNGVESVDEAVKALYVLDDDPELLDEEYFESLERRLDKTELIILQQECNDELGLIADS